MFMNLSSLYAFQYMKVNREMKNIDLQIAIFVASLGKNLSRSIMLKLNSKVNHLSTYKKTGIYSEEDIAN